MNEILNTRHPAVTDTPTHADIIARAQSLIPNLRDRAGDAERARQAPAETIQDYVDLGLLRVVQPKMFGGYELGWETMLEAVMELGRGDASQAWVAAIFAVHKFDVAMYTEQAQRDVWDANPDANVLSAVAPSGKGEWVDGGYMLNGRWSFASGVAHSDWGIIGCMAPDRNGDGAPMHHLCLVPRADYDIIDVWDVSGLCGTGSNDITIKDVFVPEHRIITRWQQRDGNHPGASLHPNPFYKTPYLPIGPMGIMAVISGCVEGALEDFIEFTKARAQRGAAVAEQQAMQIRIAEASAEIAAARHFILSSGREADRQMAEMGEMTLDARARARRTAGYAPMLARRAIDRLFEASGAHGIYKRHAFQRAMRDAKAGSNHITAGWDRAGTAYGKVALGIDPGADEI